MASVLLYAVYTIVLSLLTGRVLGSGYGSTDIQSLRYGGQFIGSCNMDGMYYMDQSSYVMCSHGIAYVMPCAPGTMNSGRQLQNLNAGDYLGFSAFCDVNLVDVGYAALVSQQRGLQSGGYGMSGGYGTGGGISTGGGYGTGGGISTGGGYGTASGYGMSKPQAKPAGTLVISYQRKTVPATYGQSQGSGYGQQAASALARIIRPVASGNMGYQD